MCGMNGPGSEGCPMMLHVARTTVTKSRRSGLRCPSEPSQKTFGDRGDGKHPARSMRTSKGRTATSRMRRSANSTSHARDFLPRNSSVQCSLSGRSQRTPCASNATDACTACNFPTASFGGNNATKERGRSSFMSVVKMEQRAPEQFQGRLGGTVLEPQSMFAEIKFQRIRRYCVGISDIT